jgi:hypothetical protein
VPKSAINQLEMWQEATFDPVEIDREFGWAEAMGMNTMRVFLHDLLWQQDSTGFRQRIDRFLAIASRHHIRPLLVLFDSVWDPLPQLGPQYPPIPGVHNSGWVQSPGAKALAERRTCRGTPGSIPTFSTSPGVASRGAAARRNTVPSGGGKPDPAAHRQPVGSFRAPATSHLHAR